MSDENTTPRRVAPEGPVPEDRESYAVPDHVPDHEPNLAPANEPDTEPDTEQDAGPDAEQDAEQDAGPGGPSDHAPADESAPVAAPVVDRDQDRVGEDTLLIDQRPQTAELPSPAPVATPSVAPVFPQAATAAGPVPAPQPGGLVTVRTGPRPGAIMLGLICLLVSAYTLVRQTTDWRFDLSLAGPISIGALGTLLLLVGLVGLLTRRKC